MAWKQEASKRSISRFLSRSDPFENTNAWTVFVCVHGSVHAFVNWWLLFVSQIEDGNMKIAFFIIVDYFTFKCSKEGSLIYKKGMYISQQF